MDESQQIILHKKLLLKAVSSFCKRDRELRPTGGIGDYLSEDFENTPQKEVLKEEKSIHSTIGEIKKRNWNAVFFGGMLRSLLVSKLDPTVSRRPRDIDIVIQGAKIEEIEKLFYYILDRKTRFGGLKLKRVRWQFDVWPLEETQSFQEDSIAVPTFEDLPWTTFFNVEAVAVDVWPRRGFARRIYSGDDQFFRSIINRTLEINRESNPYPELCVVRGLVMAANLKWKIGPRLLRYLGHHGLRLSASEFEEVQQKHYGRVQCSGKVFTSAMEAVMKVLANGNDEAVELPLTKQLTLWPEEEIYKERIHLYALKDTIKKQKL